MFYARVPVGGKPCHCALEQPHFQMPFACGVSIIFQNREQNQLWPGGLLILFGLKDTRDVHLSWIHLQEMITVCPSSFIDKCKIENLCFRESSDVTVQSRWKHQGLLLRLSCCLSVRNKGPAAADLVHLGDSVLRYTEEPNMLQDT